MQCREIHYTNTLTYLFNYACIIMFETCRNGHAILYLRRYKFPEGTRAISAQHLALRDHAARRTYMVTQHYSDTRRHTGPDISLRHSQSGSNTRMSSTKTLPDASDIRDHDTTVNPPVATSATPPSDIRSTTATRTPIMNAVCRRKETY